jgi:hypothetical protein
MRTISDHAKLEPFAISSWRFRVTYAKNFRAENLKKFKTPKQSKHGKIFKYHFDIVFTLLFFVHSDLRIFSKN